MAQIGSVRLEPSQTELKPVRMLKPKPNRTAKRFDGGLGGPDGRERTKLGNGEDKKRGPSQNALHVIKWRRRKKKRRKKKKKEEEEEEEEETPYN